MGKGGIGVGVGRSVLGIFRNTPSHNTGTTREPHQIPRYLKIHTCGKGVSLGQRCQKTGNRHAVSQGRLSRHFHPSRRTVAYPRKNASYFVWKLLLFGEHLGAPCFLFSLYVFSIIWPGVFRNTGFFTPRPRVFHQDCMSGHLP